MATPTNADETIVWRIVVESQKALDDVQKFRQEINAMKENLKRISEETGQSFDIVAKSLKATFSEESKKYISQIREEMKFLNTTIREQQALLKERPLSPTTNVAESTQIINESKASLLAYKN